MKNTTARQLVATIMLLGIIAGCSGSSSAELGGSPASLEEPTTTTEQATTTTEATTTSSTIREPTDKEQIIKLHREYMIDLYIVDERTDTEEDFQRRVTWLQNNATEPYQSNAIDFITGIRDDDNVNLNRGNLSHIVEVVIDGEEAYVQDCLSGLDQILDGTLESRSKRTAAVFWDNAYVKVDGQWKLDGSGLQGDRCDPTRAWDYQPPANPDDRADIRAAADAYFEYLELKDSVADYDVVGESERVTVDPIRALIELQDEEDEAAGRQRLGASVDYRIEELSQRENKAAVLACVDYIPPDDTEDTRDLPNYWTIYLRQENGSWKAEAELSGGQDQCEL